MMKKKKRLFIFSWYENAAVAFRDNLRGQVWTGTHTSKALGGPAETEITGEAVITAGNVVFFSRNP